MYFRLDFRWISIANASGSGGSLNDLGSKDGDPPTPDFPHAKWQSHHPCHTWDLRESEHLPTFIYNSLFFNCYPGISLKQKKWNTWMRLHFEETKISKTASGWFWYPSLIHGSLLYFHHSIHSIHQNPPRHCKGQFHGSCVHIPGQLDWIFAIHPRTCWWLQAPLKILVTMGIFPK